MATWTVCIVATAPDFWRIATRHQVIAMTTAVPPYVLISCTDFARPALLAEELSGALGTTAIGIAAQTGADTYQLRAFTAGTVVRELDYDRDGGGWTTVTGTPQAWEAAFFFDALNRPDDPDEAARFDAARLAGDPSPILRLVAPSSLAPLRALCASLQIDPDVPSGRYERPSRWAKLFVRRPR